MKRTTMALAAIALLAVEAFSAPLPDGDQLLRAIDERKNFSKTDLSTVMTMIKEDPEAGIEKNVVQQFRRDRDDKFVFLFLEPAVKKGQGYLRIEDNLWFYDPESRKFSHSSMKERFGGTDARNSDFGVSSLADQYRVLSVEEGKLGKYSTYVLDLAAANDEVTYARKKIWVTQDQYLILKSEDSSETGRLLRTSLYPSYAKVGECYLPTKTIFIDKLVEGKKTTITLAEISQAAVPDSVFTKSYIERVNR